MVIILMGVAGAGKTTIGERLAEALGWQFLEGDDFHPPANVAKMAAGIPLTDEDRAPWLERLRGLITDTLARGEDAVLASSALKQSYRQLLTVDSSQVRWVYLSAPPEVLASRLARRVGHFMPLSLLDSQLETLEAPAEALQVDVTPSPDEVVSRIRAGLGV
ncbi:gluconokinase [Hyalangium sp.]|uniref:gluconokinase n=1 Tax=Hyalangium sp. TaxID=2028555 RepID=UPI002D4331F1|nr:gluconokinase [Hyalangium sp.]HYH97776.1 gluconokinase [Hyalangium sp.]